MEIVLRYKTTVKTPQAHRVYVSRKETEEWNSIGKSKKENGKNSQLFSGKLVPGTKIY